MRYDFHTHTNASDGRLSPQALVNYAHECGVTMLAVTDHDTTAGLEEARQVSESLNVQFINGIELSVSWSNTVIHVIGLNIDPESIPLMNGIQTLESLREERAMKIGELLHKHGIDNAYQGAKALAGEATLTRSHFAQYMVEKGYVKDISKVFKHYLVRGKPGYVATQWASLEQAVNWIHSAGGIAVIAHPHRYRIGTAVMDKLLDEFRQLGGQAIEVVCSNMEPKQISRFARLSQRFGLMASTGSDYHGPHQNWNGIGQLADMPESVKPVWTCFE
ncbi:MAG: PHP domain-containing protein [Gammaproteobacteria bacterium]|nr:PHP domain-containing protein [Gammaproteobacteria bacterium]